MAIDVSQYTTPIKTAVAARDVRDNMANGMDAIANEMNTYEENLSADNDQFKADIGSRQTNLENTFNNEIKNNIGSNPSSAETAASRTDNVNNITYDTLGKRLDAQSSQLADKAKQADLNTTNANVATLTNNLTATNNNVSTLQSVKADTTYVDNKVASVASGAPDETFATLTALQTAYPIGNSKNKLVMADGHIYNWNGTAWHDTGIQYQSTGIAPGSVSLSMTNFNPISGIASKNLFNKDTVIGSTGLDATTGIQFSSSESTNYSLSDYIPITVGQQYAINELNQGAFYDANKTFIAYSPLLNFFPAQSIVLNAPANASYFRFAALTNDIGNIQLEKGSVCTSYESYGNKLKDKSIAGNQIVDKTITSENIADYTIQKNNMNFPIISGVVSKNLFDKNNITSGYYIAQQLGSLVANTNYSASDFILIEPNSNYSINYFDQIAWYDVNKNYISGVDGYQLGNKTIMSPANALYIRVSVRNTILDTYQLEKGSVCTSYESYGTFVTEDLLAEDLKAKLNNLTGFKTIKSIINVLNNPFRKTVIKLLGDSITQGMGGTGFAQDGEQIGDTTWHVNTSGTCWANMLKNYIAEKFNIDFHVPIEHEEISFTNESITYDRDYACGSRTNLTDNNSLSFSFYGNHFSVFYSKNTDNGQFKINVDGTDNQTINASSATETLAQEVGITGLTNGQHSVVISNISGISHIEGLIIPKYAQAINWGTSGNNSAGIREHITSLVQSTDDIIILSIGTNDRNDDAGKTRYRQRLYQNLIEIGDYVLGQGKQIVFTSALPASPASENNTSNWGNMLFHMEDVDNANMSAATHYNMDYISVFKEFSKYLFYTGKDITTLLADGVLHPNDVGYKIMFYIISDALGIGHKLDGGTWTNTQ